MAVVEAFVESVEELVVEVGFCLECDERDCVGGNKETLRRRLGSGGERVEEKEKREEGEAQHWRSGVVFVGLE